MICHSPHDLSVQAGTSHEMLHSWTLETKTGGYIVRKFMFRCLLVLPLLAGVWLASYPAGTRMVQKWVAPDVAKYKFDHILTICIVKDETTRQTGGRCPWLLR